MFCNIQFQDSGETRSVKTEELIVFGRKNTYTKFEPSSPNDYKPRSEYGLIDGEVVKRCLILAIAATLETLQTIETKPKKVSSKRAAVESLAAFTFNSKKSKQDRTGRGAEATDELISGKLKKATGIAMQVGLEVAAQLAENFETAVNVNDRDNNSKADDTSKVDNTPKTADKKPNERASFFERTKSDEEKLLDNGSSLDSEKTGGNELPDKPLQSSSFDLGNLSDDDDVVNQNLDKNKIINPSSPISLPNKESLEIDVREGIQPPAHKDQMQKSESLKIDVSKGTRPPAHQDQIQESLKIVKQGTQPPKHLDQMQESADSKTLDEEFKLVGNDKEDGDTLMTMFNKMLSNQKDIAEQLKSLDQKIGKIFQYLFNSGQSTSGGPSTSSAFVHSDFHIENIPGKVCFGEGLYLDSNKMKGYCQDSQCVQTTINNISLGVFKDDLTSYCLRLPKENPKGLKLLPNSFINKLTEVINEANRERSFNDFLQQEKKILKALKPDQINQKLEEIRKLSNLQCIDMTVSEVKSKLSHTLYEVRKLIAAPKNEAGAGKSTVADAEKSSESEGGDRREL